MANPVDLSNLREITGDDKELEKELFQEFINSSEINITKLEESLESSNNASWRSAAHALKGISMNLGALELTNLFKTAQDNYENDATDKRNQLKKIKAEYAEVKNFLNAQ